MNPLPKDPRKEKLKAFAQYQIYCLVLAVAIIVVAVLLHHLKTLGPVSVLPVLAVVFLEVQKQALKKAIAADDAEYRRQNPGSTPGVWPPPPL